MENHNNNLHKENQGARPPTPSATPNNAYGHFIPPGQPQPQHPIHFGENNPYPHQFNPQFQHPVQQAPGYGAPGAPQQHPYLQNLPPPRVFYNMYGGNQNMVAPGGHPHPQQTPASMPPTPPQPPNQPVGQVVAQIGAIVAQPQQAKKKGGKGAKESDVEVGGTQKGKGRKKKAASEPADSDDEVEQNLSTVAKEAAGLKVPTKKAAKGKDKEEENLKYRDMAGKHWSNEETMILLDFFLAPERVQAVTLDATRFITKLVELDTIQRDAEPIRSRWNYLLSEYKDAIALRAHTGGGDGDVDRIKQGGDQEARAKIKKIEAFLASPIFAKMDAAIGTRPDILRRLQLTPSAAAVPSDNEGNKRPAKKQRILEDPSNDTMLDAIKESAINSKKTTEINNQRLELEREKLGLERERVQREIERDLADRKRLDDAAKASSQMAREKLILDKLELARQLKADPELKEHADALFKEAIALRKGLDAERAVE